MSKSEKILWSIVFLLASLTFGDQVVFFIW